jgi:hypothetical protein
VRLYMALVQAYRLQCNYKPLRLERATETANTMYLTFKSKNDTDDEHIYFTGECAHGCRSISCGHRSTGFTPSSLMTMFHKVGPETDPCGQPLVTRLELTELPKVTWAFRKWCG